MQGMNAKTGAALSGIEHLKQSVYDILSTPVGTRIMRRSYGSRLMYLLDAPTNEFLVAQIQAAVVEALGNYEPRISITQVSVNSVADGQVNLTIDGYYIPDKKMIRLENIAVQ